MSRECECAARAINQSVKLRTIYYQQVGAIKVKADRQIKDTELEQVCRLVPTSSVTLSSALHVKVIDPSQLSFCYLVEESVAPMIILSCVLTVLRSECV